MNERTKLILAMFLCGLILFGWVPLMHGLERATGYQLLQRQPEVAASTDSTTQQSPPPPATAPAFIGSTTLPTSGPTIPPPNTVVTVRLPDVNIGSAAKKDKTFAVQLQVSPVGGGLAGVVLNDFNQSVDSQDPFEFEQPIDEQTHAFATRSVKIDGHDVPLNDQLWRFEAQTDHSVTVAYDLPDANGTPALTLLKTYEVQPRDEGGAHGPLGYDTKFTYSFVNHTGRPLVVSSTINGPTFPESELPRGGDRSVIAGYQAANNVVKLRRDLVEGLTGSGVTKEFVGYENEQMLWFGAGTNYFNAIVRPTSGNWIKSAVAHARNPESEVKKRQVELQLETTDLALAPGETKAVTAQVYFGPRRREVLKNPYYTAAGIGYEHTLESTGSCAFCTFQWLVDFLMLLLGMFETVLRSWGLAIIALVFVVRACLHPITKRSQINMAKMGTMGPEIERIKKKYGDDKDALNRAMMEFYKTQGATPILGCLPMFLQMPIWIALYSGLGSTFELRQAPLLSLFGHNLTWVRDLSKPDTLIPFHREFDFFFLHFDALNLIPFLLAVVFFLQQKLTPKPPATTPEQQQQQKMMQWMTLLFPLMLYNSPSGLNLYILASTTFGIIESRIIRKHIKEREALQAAGPTFVDGEVIDRKNKDNDAKKKTAPGGLMGWFQQLQERAEQIRNEAEKKARDRRR